MMLLAEIMRVYINHQSYIKVRSDKLNVPFSFMNDVAVASQQLSE